MHRIITLQPEPFIDNIWGVKGAVAGEGKIVFGEKLPYPFHVGEDGKVLDQDFWRGDPYSVVGFQADEDVQKIDVWWGAVVADPELAVGKFPVMTERGKGMYTYTIKIESVSVREAAS